MVFLARNSIFYSTIMTIYYTTFSRENVSVFYFADVPIVSLQFGTILKPHSIKEALWSKFSLNLSTGEVWPEQGIITRPELVTPYLILPE